MVCFGDWEGWQVAGKNMGGVSWIEWREVIGLNFQYHLSAPSRLTVDLRLEWRTIKKSNICFVFFSTKNVAEKRCTVTTHQLLSAASILLLLLNPQDLPRYLNPSPSKSPCYFFMHRKVSLQTFSVLLPQHFSMWIITEALLLFSPIQWEKKEILRKSGSALKGSNSKIQVRDD